jgi:hypothetical protein
MCAFPPPGAICCSVHFTYITRRGTRVDGPWEGLAFQFPPRVGEEAKLFKAREGMPKRKVPEGVYYKITKVRHYGNATTEVFCERHQ